MSYYYYQLPQAEELDDTMYSGGSLRHTTNRGRTSHHQPYRPRSSTDSIPFVDADQPRSRDPATSSSEETVNRLASYPQTDPRGGAASLRRRRRYPPPPPSPPATFLDSEDATSLNNLLDALDDLDVEEDRRSSLATTGSSRDDEVEEAVVPHNGPPRPTLASILVSIPPPPTPPPPENEMSIEQRQELQKLRQLQKHPMRRINPSSAANHNVSFVLPPPPPSPPKEHPQPKPPCNDEIIIVDHVMDRTTHQRIRLLYPYVFKVKHGHALELYGLKFMHLVNGEAHEQVINKNCKKYLGCDDNPSSVNPTCGFAYNEESVVPYSQGFCCSCDSVVNTHREVPVPVGDPKEDSIKNRRRTISTHSTNHLRLRHHNFSMNNKHKISKHHREKSKEAISNSDDRGEISTVKQSHSHQRRSSKSEPSKGSYSDYRKDNAKFTPGYAEMHDEDYPKELEYAGQRFARHATHKRELISSSEINEAKSTSANITKHQGETSINNRYKREPEKLKEPFRVEIPIPRSVSPIKNEINQWKRKPDEDYFYDNVDSELYDDEKHHRSSKENESLHKRRRDVKSDYGSYSIESKINEEDEEMSKGNYNYRPSRKGKLRAKAKQNKNNDIADLLNYDHARDYDDEESNLVFDQNSQFPSKFPRVSPKSSNSLDYKRLQISKRSKDEGLYEENNEDASEDSIAELHKKHSTVGLKIAQHRGGQNCANKSTPPFADPETYHKSAHCLRFSDLWYSVYGLEKPIIDPNMYIHIFERHSCGEENQWVDLTQGKSVRVGPFCPKVTDDTSTYSITYTYCDERNEEDFALDYKTDRLLIPEPVSDENAALYPQLQGGPKEYLVVKKDKISTNGEDCDKAGVSYEAFVKQPNRCHKPKGTCLKNQPIDLWRQDIKARLKGKKGQYFLENFGVLPKDPVKMAGLEREEYISLKFDGKYSSTLDIEINADRNALVESFGSHYRSARGCHVCSSHSHLRHHNEHRTCVFRLHSEISGMRPRGSC